MRRLFHLPNELLQQITSLFRLRDKHNFLATTKKASSALYNNDIEQRDVWDKIFKDTVWLKRMLSHGVTPALVGYDLKYMQEDDEFKSDRLFIALTLARPRGNWYKANEKELSASIRSDSPISKDDNYVYFPGFILHIGCLFNEFSLFEGWEGLLEENADFSLVLYYQQSKTQTFPLDVTIKPAAGGSFLEVRDRERDWNLGTYFELRE